MVDVNSSYENLPVILLAEKGDCLVKKLVEAFHTYQYKVQVLYVHKKFFGGYRVPKVRALSCLPDQYVLINTIRPALNVRWNKKYLKKLGNLLVDIPLELLNALQQAYRLPTIYMHFSSSYIFQGEIVPCFEDYPIRENPGCLAEIFLKSESTANAFSSYGAQVSILRLPFILEKSIYPLQKFLAYFLEGSGYYHGDGMQPFPWIGFTDFFRIINFLITEPYAGTFHIASPGVERQYTFAKELQNITKAIHMDRVPKWLLKLIYKQMAKDYLLRQVNIIPRRLQQLNFIYKHRDLKEYLAEHLAKEYANNLGFFQRILALFKKH